MENSGGSAQDTSTPPLEGVSGGGTSYGWSNGEVHGSGYLRGTVDPTEVRTADLLHVWSMPSTANVGQQEMPRPMEPIKLLAARNERESTQIALRPKVSWAGSGIAGVAQIHCTDLCSTSGDRLVVGQSLSLRHVAAILGVPDALVPLDLPVSQINLNPMETSVIWVSVDVPTEQPPGLYEGEIIISAMKEDTLSSVHGLPKFERHQIHSEIKSCLDIVGAIDDKPCEDVVERVKSLSATLQRVLLSPTFLGCCSNNGSSDMMDEDVFNDLSVQLKLSVTVWEFSIPVTPSLPAVFGISETVIEDRYGVEHGSDEWYNALDQHFKWLLQYRISPFFCRWGNGMRVLAYTCPWPADHSKSDEYYSDPRLAAYAVPFAPILSGSDAAKSSLQKEVELLKTKSHWKKAYFYLWDEPMTLEHYNSIRSMSTELRTYAPDARVLTTYYSGPNDAPLAPTNFEAFLEVPNFLRPHTQIYCTSELMLGNRDDLVDDIISEIQADNGEEWWTYVCLGPSDPQPNWHLGMRGTQHRAVMWRVWKEGGTGFLYWGSNCYEKATVASAEIKFRRGLPPGDGVLFYPGEVFSTNQLVASMRLERILSGLQDIEYLKLYASKYGRQASLALLEKTGVYQGPEQYTSSHMPIDTMRAEVYYACRF
ncbi:hypothetical protein Sjap_010419 [Stephania japonica]|uniref:Glycoside hydrolase 123 catalytic domain-containing protein n=1 Tax=Stephania japonica TaxID=461633 RepID=A0AAP0JBL0_9MAGN